MHRNSLLNESTYQTINSTEIYKENATEILNFTSFVFQNMGNWGGLAVALISTSLLPLTTTIGAGIWTADTMRRRKPLLLIDVNNTLQKIGSLNDEEMDFLTTEICNQKKELSKNCLKLQTDLQNLDNAITRERVRLKNVAEQETYDAKLTILQEKIPDAASRINHFIKENNYTFFKVVDTSTQLCQLSDEEKSIADRNSKEKYSEILEQKKYEKTELIKKFLTIEQNAGKKMQHIIVDAVSHFKNTITERQVFRR